MTLVDDSMITCTTSPEGLALVFQDGTRTDVPVDVIRRSKTLSDSVAAAGSDGEFKFVAPHGYLQNWLRLAGLAAEQPPHTLRSTEACTLVELLRVWAEIRHSAV